MQNKIIGWFICKAFWYMYMYDFNLNACASMQELKKANKNDKINKLTHHLILFCKKTINYFFENIFFILHSL